MPAQSRTTGRQQRTDNKVPRIPCQNASGTNTVPPFGLVYVSGWNATNGVALVDKPNADSIQVYVNGPAPINPSGYGVVSMAWPLFAAYDSGSGTPAVGDVWGAASGSYLLTHGKAGLVVQGTPAKGRVLVAQQSASGGITVSSAINNASGFTATTFTTVTTISLAAGSYLLSTNSQIGITCNNTRIMSMQIIDTTNSVLVSAAAAQATFPPAAVGIFIGNSTLCFANQPYVVPVGGATLAIQAKLDSTTGVSTCAITSAQIVAVKYA